MIQQNVSLQSFNTFGIDAQAKFFGIFRNTDELCELLNAHPEENLLILGGGSNILFTGDYDGLVLKNEILGIEILEESEFDVLLRVGAGENWHQFVLYCIEKGYAGIENLSLIPGSVGASPMQNIGAYGVEIKDVFEYLEALHIANGEIEKFGKLECHFGYRESVFKNKHKDEYVITYVCFRLKKQEAVNTSYGAIETELKAQGIVNPGIRDVSNAVIAIRQSKLPDPKEIGNAGSFFKNPVVSIALYEKVKSIYPDVPNYPAAPGFVKIPAGWLIEQAGWKGKTLENYGVHKNQALVLVNYGGASGQQLWDLSTAIKEDVFAKFGVELEREVNVV